MMSLSKEKHDALINTLKERFEKNKNRHAGIVWDTVQAKLETQPEKLWSLNRMEETGGEPDVVCLNPKATEFFFYDCEEESPKGRRSLCYDGKALASRKENKPVNSVIDMAAEMGIDLLTEEQYRELQLTGPYDSKTSSWIVTPDDIRKFGGAIFADFRYGTVFVYHNGADSYYGARGFRGALKI